MSELYSAAHDDNQTRHFSALGVIGTLGTADVQGSANTLSFSVDPSTGAAYNTQLGTADARITQNVVADDNNSSTANLAPGATYTGTITSTLGIVGIQVSLKTDQNCMVYVDQSPNTTPNWDISDEYNYYTSINNFGITVQAINSYCRVRVKNTGSGTTTYFRLQTALCPIVEALPRSLNENGNLKVHTIGDEDGYGFEAENTPIGEKRVVIPTRLVGAAYEGTIVDTNFWGTAGANGGSVTQANAQVTVTTGTAADGSASQYSARRARYVSAAGMNYRAIIQQDAGSAGNKRRWGIAYGTAMPTITDGAYFQLEGTTSSVVTLKGGTAGTISTGSFNGNLGADYSWGTIAKTYEIYWTNSKVWFVIGDNVLHTVTASATTWADTMSHYIFMDNANSGGSAGNINSYCRVSSIRRLGQLVTQPMNKFQSGLGTATLKYSPGNIHGVNISAVTNNAVVTLFDSIGTSAGTIWSSGQMAANVVPFSIDMFDIAFSNALTLTVTGAAANAQVAYE